MNNENTCTNSSGRFLMITSVLIPIVMLYLGHIYKEVEIRQGIHEKYVIMAIDILHEPPTPERAELRKWAIKVLDRYSEIPIHLEAQQHLIKSSLPNEIKP